MLGALVRLRQLSASQRALSALSHWEDSIKCCYQSPYVGDGAAKLKQSLQARADQFDKPLPNQAFHSKLVELVNSSCMGKSRTVLELGKSCGVFVCYASLGMPGVPTYPPRSDPLARHLEASTSVAQMVCYLCAWVDELSHFLAGEAAADLAARNWIELQEQCFKEQAPQDSVFNRVAKRWTVLNASHPGRGGGLAEERELHQMLATRINSLVQNQNQVEGGGGTELKLLFVVDEVNAKLPFCILCRACRKLAPGSLMLVVQTSARVIREGNALHPVCQLHTIDALAGGLEMQSVLSATRGWLEDPARWTRYGRPIWGLRFAADKDLGACLDFATAKLLNLEDEEGGSLGELTALQSVALLAQTIGLDVWPASMGAVVGVFDSGRGAVTVTPLDPVLSCAAGRILGDPKTLAKVLRSLNNHLVTHRVVMSRGERLQTAYKLLLMMAMWRCQGSSSAGMMKCVPALDLLRCLVSEKLELSGLLQDSYVFFNRITRMDHPPSRKEASELMKRGVIVAGSRDDGEHECDLYIFTICNPPTTTLDPQAELTYLTTSILTNGSKSDAEHAKCTPRSLNLSIKKGVPHVFGKVYFASDLKSPPPASYTVLNIVNEDESYKDDLYYEVNAFDCPLAELPEYEDVFLQLNCLIELDTLVPTQEDKETLAAVVPFMRA